MVTLFATPAGAGAIVGDAVAPAGGVSVSSLETAVVLLALMVIAATVVAVRAADLAQVRGRQLAELARRRMAFEEAVSDQVMRLGIAVQAMPNGIVMFDRNQRVSVYNRLFLDLWDLTDEEVHHHGNLAELIRFLAERGDYGPGDPAALAAERLKVVQSEDVTRSVIRRAGGRVLEVHGFGKAGIGYVFTYLDITDRCEAELALAAKAAMLNTVIEAMPNGIMVFDDDLTITLYNSRFLEIWGLPRELLAENRNLRSMVAWLAARGEYGNHGTTEERTDDRLKTLGARNQIRHEFRRPNGRVIEIHGLGRTAVGHVLSYLDVTEQRRAERTVRDSERRLRELLRQSPIGIAIRSSGGRLQFWNPAFAAMATGAGPDGSGAAETGPAEAADSWVPPFARLSDLQAITAAVATRATIRGFEAELRRGDGKSCWCQLDLLPFEYEGEPASIFWVQDITERKRIDRDLRQSRRFLRAIIDAIPANINVKDREQRFVLMNAFQAELCGTDPDAAVGRIATDFMPYRINAAWAERDRRVLQTGATIPFYETEFNYFAADDRHWLISKLPLRDETGEVRYVLSVGLEISDRRRFELALRESEERLKLALSVSRAGVWDIDFRTRRRWWSQEVTELTGHPVEEINRHGLRPLIHAEDWPALRTAVRRHLLGQEREYRAEYRVRHLDGRWLWLQDVGRMIRDDKGSPVRFIGIVADVTDQRATEAELVRAEQMAALGRLVAGVAHEINTPLGLGVGLASHQQERVAALRRSYQAGSLTHEDLEDFLAEAVESSAVLVGTLGRAADLVRSFKLVSVDQTSDLLRTIDLRSYLEEIIVAFGPKLRRSSHKIAINCADGVALVTHPGAVSRILTNLVDNSFTHAFESMQEGLISIAAACENDWVTLTYRDNGCGMTSDQTARIFEPFFTTKRGRGGSGLGMHIVYNLVTQTLGGQIAVSSEPGAGVAVVIHFPATLVPATPGGDHVVAV